MNIVTITQKEFDSLKSQERRLLEIEDGISEFYSEENEDSDLDLGDIGEWITSYLGWL